jgi:hypothetical protein
MFNKYKNFGKYNWLNREYIFTSTLETNNKRFMILIKELIK